jgi:hypothetical protein
MKTLVPVGLFEGSNFAMGYLTKILDNEREEK